VLSVGTRKRISRISRRAIPEVQAAYVSGKISARRADTLLYLPSEQQSVELARILAIQEQSAERSRIAAAVIQAHVGAGRRDLVALKNDLQFALSSPTMSIYA
jgi:hypothetical protein